MSSEINVDYINEVLNETVDDDDKQNLPEDWEEGLTFTARSSRKYTDISFCRPPAKWTLLYVMVCDYCMCYFYYFVSTFEIKLFFRWNFW